jgi:hypothetical protein
VRCYVVMTVAADTFIIWPSIERIAIKESLTD